MLLTAKEKSLLDALEPQAAEQGVEIVTVEIVGAKKAPTIRVFIDTPCGVSFEELASAQVWINGTMDRIDPFTGAYSLEVSSPGIDRPLRTREHFERFAGEAVCIQTVSPIEGRSKWSGKLGGIDGGHVLVEVDGTVEHIDFDNIKRANVKGTVDFTS